MGDQQQQYTESKGPTRKISSERHRSTRTKQQTYDSELFVAFGAVFETSRRWSTSESEPFRWGGKCVVLVLVVLILLFLLLLLGRFFGFLLGLFERELALLGGRRFGGVVLLILLIIVRVKVVRIIIISFLDDIS